ncbi:MAG TPA: hypothetical protein ENJ09_00400 [Planctomycetes bacterium]|nr:hypothetical protein [Planctomycetota bacterium]
MKTLQKKGRRALGEEQRAARPGQVHQGESYRITEAQLQSLVRALWEEIAREEGPAAEPVDPPVRRRTRRRPSLGRRMAHRVVTGRHA